MLTIEAGRKETVLMGYYLQVFIKTGLQPLFQRNKIVCLLSKSALLLNKLLYVVGMNLVPDF